MIASPEFVVLTIPDWSGEARPAPEVRYEAYSLSQAQGFIDATGEACQVAMILRTFRSELTYRINVIDTESGQLVALGPVVDLHEAEEMLYRLRLVLMPVCAEAGKGVRA